MVGDLTMDSAPTVGNLIIDKVKSPIIPTYSRTVEVGHAIDKCITCMEACYYIAAWYPLHTYACICKVSSMCIG